MDGEGGARNEIISFFRSRWSTNGDDVASYALPDPISCVSDQENMELIRTVFVEEIKRMLWSWLRIMLLDLMAFPHSFQKILAYHPGGGGEGDWGVFCYW